VPFLGDGSTSVVVKSSQGTWEQVVTTTGGSADDTTRAIRAVGRPYIAAVALWVGGAGAGPVTVRVEFIQRNTWRTLTTLSLAAIGSRVAYQGRMPSRRVRLVVVDPDAGSPKTVLCNFGASGM
jgi:hypothetical protein